MVAKRGQFLYWLAGCLVALLGVGVVRLPSGPLAEAYRLPLLILGTTIAFVGLWIITKGHQPAS